MRNTLSTTTILMTIFRTLKEFVNSTILIITILTHIGIFSLAGDLIHIIIKIMDIHTGIHGATTAMEAMVTVDITAITTGATMEVIMGATMVTIVGIHLITIMAAILITAITIILITHTIQKNTIMANAVQAGSTLLMLAEALDVV